MSIVQEDHKATLRKWHEDLQEKRGHGPACGAVKR